MSNVDARVISEIQERLERDPDTFKRVLQSFGIPTKRFLLGNPFNKIFTLFPDTPVTIVKDVFEALQLHDLLELLEKTIKPSTYRSLQLAFTLDEIKKLNGVTDLPTTYHSCGAVLIITDDGNVSNASEIKNFFTDLDNNSDVTEVIQSGFELSYIQFDTTLRNLKEKIDAMRAGIVKFENLLESETLRENEVTQNLLIEAVHKLWTFQLEGIKPLQSFIVKYIQLKDVIEKIRLDLNNRLKNPSEGKTELWQTDEFKKYIQSMLVTVDRMQENLTQLIQEKEKEGQNFREDVSAVINRWIHRQGKYE